jgi:hypothetical protein
MHSNAATSPVFLAFEGPAGSHRVIRGLSAVASHAIGFADRRPLTRILELAGQLRTRAMATGCVGFAPS